MRRPTRIYEKRNQIWAYDKDFDKIYREQHPEGKHKEARFVAPDGNRLIYKCHIVLAERHFYEVDINDPNQPPRPTREIMAQFLHDNGFPHKVAPISTTAAKMHPRSEKGKANAYFDVHDLQSAGKQIGKCFTIYYPSEHLFYVLVKGVRALIERYNLEGIPVDYFEKRGANLQYEFPVPGTNDIVYYTVEQIMMVNRKPKKYFRLEYPDRKAIMNEYHGTGPLDFLFPRQNPSGEAFR